MSIIKNQYHLAKNVLCIRL